ncbi:hypothetical protein AB9T89_17825 [Flavobacterium oncorhynchi]|uniref:hypothetical protein n=1 Tax=Flavobacterium oncorhynchi TaxID=728056 RepID=UPI00351A96D8
MGLLERTVENKDGLYKLALEYFQNIEVDEYENINFDKIIPKSISILIDHDFIPTPCIEIRLDLYQQEQQLSNCKYILYVDEKKDFVDEFLIFN